MQHCTMIRSVSSRVMMAIKGLGLNQGDVSLMGLGVDKILLAKVCITCTSLPINVLWLQSDKATIGHFRVLLCLCFKTSLSAKPFIWKWFCMQLHFDANQSHFHNNGFALRLALEKIPVPDGIWAHDLGMLCRVALWTEMVEQKINSEV